MCMYYVACRFYVYDLCEYYFIWFGQVLGFSSFCLCQLKFWLILTWIVKFTHHYLTVISQMWKKSRERACKNVFRDGKRLTSFHLTIMFLSLVSHFSHRKFSHFLANAFCWFQRAVQFNRKLQPWRLLIFLVRVEFLWAPEKSWCAWLALVDLSVKWIGFE